MKFTKKEILAAIKFEPLVGGDGWISAARRASGMDKPLKQNCTVCAVGGLLRRKVARKQGFTIRKLCKVISFYFGLGNDPVTGTRMLRANGAGESNLTESNTLEQAREDAEFLIEEGHHLAALSKLFETHTFADNEDGIVTPKVRRALARDIRKMFPASFEADINLEKEAA